MQNLTIEPETLKSLAEILDQIKDSETSTAELLEDTSKDKFPEATDLLKLFSSFRSDIELIQQFLLQENRSSVISRLMPIMSIEKIKALGIWLIKNRYILKPVQGISLNHAISNDYWQTITQSIFPSKKFQPLLANLQQFYHKALDKEIDEELKRVPMKLEPEIVAKYRKVYYQSPMTFEAFLNLQSTKSISVKGPTNPTPILSNQISPSTGDQLRKQFESAVEKKKVEEKKDQQQKSFDNYHGYFEMDQRELNRAKRQGENPRRAFKKQTRREKFKK